MGEGDSTDGGGVITLLGWGDNTVEGEGDSTIRCVFVTALLGGGGVLSWGRETVPTGRGGDNIVGGGPTSPTRGRGSHSP